MAGAIRTASVHIAIFSPGYADSHWCLNELLLMLESGSTILPVFYNVKPSDLRWTSGGDSLSILFTFLLQCVPLSILGNYVPTRAENGVYARALRRMQKKTTFDSQTNKKKPRYDSDTIEKWRKALSDVSQISGFELNACNGMEWQLVDEVVRQVLKKVSKPLMHVANFPSGLDEKIKDVESKLSLQRQSGKPRVLGLVGLGGVGKTTLAKEFFNRYISNYARSCFLSNVRENAAKGSLNLLQITLLKDLVQLDAQINSSDQGIEKLKMYLSSSPEALIVIDDIDHIDQLDALVKPLKDTIHPSSLILVTSRNKDVLTSSGIVESSIYTVKGLNPQNSEELFCLHAFGQTHPFLGFEELVEKILDVCNGLPLSLKVLGALLSGTYDLEYWNAQLHKTSKILPSDIQSRLKISFDSLDKEEKQIFLDIACFFIGEDRDTAMRIWDGCGWEGFLGLWKLESRCLVEVDSENCLTMHDHLRDLGRDMAVNSEYGRRLWCLTDNLLPNVSDQSHVRGISIVGGKGRKQSLDVNDPEQSLENLADSCNLSKLELLMAESYFVERVLNFGKLLPLVYLRWDNCPNPSLPRSIPIKKLRVLHIKGKILKTLWQHESKAPLDLRELHISAPLSEVPESIGKLKDLERFILNSRYLETLPDEFCRMHSLKHIGLKYCKKMKQLPDSVCYLPNLQRLELCGCSSLQGLPDSIENLTSLQSLDLGGCSALQTLPDLVGKLTGLQSLDLRRCSTLQTLPDLIGNLMCLQSLDLHRCLKLQMLPDSVGNLTGLQSLDLRGCSILQALPDSVGNLTGLQSLDLRGCSTLQALPDSVGNLTRLESLDLRGCSTLQTLPDSVGNLTGLRLLELGRCSILQTLPDSVANLTGLQSLDLDKCSTLKTLPDSVGNLTGLQRFDLVRCSTLQELPDSVGNLTGLQHLDLGGCSTLETLPDSLGNLTGLQRLDLGGCCTLHMLPDSVGNLMGLRRLDLRGCSTLQTLPESVRNLTGLQRLDLRGFSRLVFHYADVPRLG